MSATVQQARGRRSGFTLVELTLVVTIMAIVFGLVVLRMDNLSPFFRLRKASRLIAARIRMVQDECTLQNRKLFLVYDFDTQKYWIEIPPSDAEGSFVVSDGEKVGEEKLPPGIIIEEVLGPDNERSSDFCKIELRPTGETGSHIVHLRIKDSQREDDRLSVKYNSFSGLTSIAQGYIEFQKPPETQEESIASE